MKDKKDPKKDTNLKSFVQRPDGGSLDTSGYIPTALPYNLGAVSQQLNLFDGLDEIEKDKIESSDKYYLVDRRNRRIAISSIEKKVIYALGVFVADILKDDKLKSLVTDDKVDSALTSYQYSIDIKKFAKLIYHRSKTEQQEKLLSILDGLAGKYQAVQLEYNNGKKVTISTPLIKIEEKVIVEDMNASIDDRLEKGLVKVSFGRLFFWNIHKRYAFFPTRLFEIWNKKGNGTETNLFDVLLDTLLYHRWHHISAYKTAESALKDELKAKGQKLPLEEYKKELYKRREIALTYRESLSSILDRVETKYVKSKKMPRFEKDLEKVITILKGEHVGIIADFRKEITPAETYLYFKYSLSYGHAALPFRRIEEEIEAADAEIINEIEENESQNKKNN